MFNYCCDSFEESCKEGFIKLYESPTHSDYTLQVYLFEDEDKRCEFVLGYCPFCGTKLKE